MILGLLWTKQNWRQLNTAFLICQGFSIRPDFSIRANINYWRFWSKVFKMYVVIEKLSHGLLNFLNHSLYINPAAESLKKSWFIFEFVLYTGKIPKDKAISAGPLRDTTCYWILLHCLVLNPDMYRILYILLFNHTFKVRGSSHEEKNRCCLLTVSAS